MRARRVALVGGGVVAAWVIGLVIAGAVLGEAVRARVAARIGESIGGGSASFAGGDLALVRGRATFAGLAARRDDLVGKLTIDVAAIECSLAPLGLVIFDRDCGELDVRGLRVEVSAAALLRLPRPKRTPIHVDRVVVEDAVFAFSPSAFAPDLGKIEIRIARAEAGPTTFKTPLSWLFSLRALDAALDLPAGIHLQIGYRAGVLRAAGSLFGQAPVELEVELPGQDLGEDAAAETARLVSIGKSLAEQLVAKKASDWWRALRR